MRLIDWERFIAAMSAQGVDRKQTYLKAKEAKFENLEAWVASVFLNSEDENPPYTLRLMARDPTFPPFLRALMCMRLANIAGAALTARSWRAAALEQAREVQHGADRGFLLCWIENMRYMHRDLRCTDWTKFRNNLGFLVTNGHADATRLALYFVESNLESDKIDRAEKVLSDLIYRMGRQEVPFSHDQVLRAGELKATIGHLKSKRLRAKKKQG